MAKVTEPRHHAAHPPTQVKPNYAINPDASQSYTPKQSTAVAPPDAERPAHVRPFEPQANLIRPMPQAMEEKAAPPTNPNPSLGPVGILDAANSRAYGPTDPPPFLARSGDDGADAAKQTALEKAKRSDDSDDGPDLENDDAGDDDLPAEERLVPKIS